MRLAAMVLLALLVLPGLAASGQPTPDQPATFAYSYNGPSIFKGPFQATCDGRGIEFNNHHAGATTFSARGGRLLHHVVWINQTVLANSVVYPEATINEYESELPSGTFHVSWPGSGSMTVWADDTWNGSPGFNVTLRGHNLSASEIDGDRHGPWGHYYKSGDGRAGWNLGNWPGWSRTVSIVGDATVTGPSRILFREALLTFPDGKTLQVGPYRTDSVVADAGAAARYVVRVEEVVLEIPAAEFPFEGKHGLLICSRLSGHGTGSLSSAGAVGRIALAGNETTLNGEVLSYGGQFTWDETPRGPVKAGVGWMDVKTTGQIAWVQEDYVAVIQGNTPGALRLVEAGGIAAILIAILYFFKNAGSIVGWFYSRIEPDALLHDPRRRALMESIAQNPGATRKALAERMGVNEWSLRYHIDVLARSHKVVSHRASDGIRLWPTGAGTPGSREYRVAMVQGQPRLLALINELAQPQPQDAVRRALQAKLNMPERSARRIIDRAVKLRIIHRDATGVLRCD